MSDHDEAEEHEAEAEEVADEAVEKSAEQNGKGKTNGEKRSKKHRSRSRSKRTSSRSSSSRSSSSRHRSSRHKKKHRHHRRSKSRSKSHSRRARRRRSRSASGSKSRSRSRSRNAISRSSGFGRNTMRPDMENPPPSRCLGVFGLSLYTDEKTLSRHFSQYGHIDRVQIVYDKKSDRSRGFSFLYFNKQEDAVNAKEASNGVEIDGHRIRVDFSMTKKAHTPTPGVYMGRPSYGFRSGSPSRSPPYFRRRRSRSYSPRR